MASLRSRWLSDIVMRLSRHTGNPNIGVFATANESFAFISADASPEFERAIEGALGVKTFKTTVAGAHVIGSLMAMNSNCAVVTGLADAREIALIEENLPVYILDDSLNAAGNNILVNDHGAIISPDYGEKVAAELSDALGVEAVLSSIAGCNTVGSVCKATNKGCVCHMDASDDEIALIKDVLKVEAVRSSVNHGSRMVGAGMVANSKGAVVGDETTPIEMGKIEDGLVLY